MVDKEVHVNTAEEVKYALMIGLELLANYVKLAFISINRRLGTDLGSPPLISDYSLSCDSEQAEALSSGYNISYLICIY